MFGWDWGPRIPDGGILRDVTVCYRDAAWIEDVHIRQRHEEGYVILAIQAEMGKGSREDLPLFYEVSVTAPDGAKLRETGSPREIRINNPILWWPNGLGSPNLYEVEIRLFAGDRLLDTWKKESVCAP